MSVPADAALPEVGHAAAPIEPWRWDLFCRVVDNFGDIGVNWRLAADLAARGQRVRLWTDDASALAWMAPEGAAGVEVRRWCEPFPEVEPGDVVVEAFACDPPPSFVAAMARRRQPPHWLNLEYLSAEPWVERCHGLPSPQSAGPGRGLTKWFFHPGFTPATGGLLREPGLLRERAAFDAEAWRRTHGLHTAPGERLVTLFCYGNPALPALLKALGEAPTLLALTPGPATAQVRGLWLPPRVRTVELPWLTQPGYDRLLWSADLNLVRGEDSLVRAIWAGVPFVWQLYPQHDGAHGPKAEAFLARWRQDAQASAALADAVTALFLAWNGLHPQTAAPWQAALAMLSRPAPVASARPSGAPGAWTAAARAFAQCQAVREDLTTQLLHFVARRQAAQKTRTG